MRVVGVGGEGAYGGPEALRVFECPERHAGTGEIRRAVHAASVNPTDTFIRNGTRHATNRELDPPYVPGMDVAGTRIRAEVPGGVDGVALQHTSVLEAIGDGGALAAVRPFVGVTARGITVHLVSVRNYALRSDALDRLRQLVEERRVTLRVAATYPPERAGEAHALLERGGTRGRLVIEFRPEP